MGLVSITLPSDGTTADVADVNTPLTAIVTVMNGNIDNSNISGVSGSKVTLGTLPGTALDTNTQGGWLRGILPAVSSVTANGNRSYNVTFASSVASYLTPGMRVRTTRTVAAPTQCTSLNGTTQYYSKSSPNKSTFTNNFVVFAAIKPSSYALGTIVSVYNGTSGWALRQLATGQIELAAYNAGAANFFKFTSYQSVTLSKWTNDVVVQIDMSVTTNTATTNYIMIDGVDVPGVATRGGTNPVALIQAGNLNIGAENGGTNPYAGKIAQVGWFTTKVTQATMLTYLSQGLIGTETSLGSAYSFNNLITDLNTTTPNDLTANGSALATNADSPFSVDATGIAGGTYDFGVVQKVATTVATIQVPEGNTIPTTGGVSSVDFAPSGVPYGFPKQSGRWRVLTNLYSDTGNVTVTGSTPTNMNGFQLQAAVGEWIIGAQAIIGCNASVSGSITSKIWINQTTTPSTNNSIAMQRVGGAFNSTNNDVTFNRSIPISITATTTYTLVYLAEAASGTPSYRNYNIALGVEQSLFYLDLANL